MTDHCSVSTLNFHFARNYGALIQALALSEILKNNGISVSIIDYRPEGHESLYSVKPNPFASLTWAWQGAATATGSPSRMIAATTRRMAGLGRAYIRIRERRAIDRAFEECVQSWFSLSTRYRSIEQLRKDPPQADAYVVGSDQVWNPLVTGGFDPAYFLDFGNDTAQRIAYAISPYHLNLPRNAQKIAALGHRLNYVSLREPDYIDTLSIVLKQKIDCCLDPVLMMSADDFEPFEEKKGPPNRRYILVYLLHTSAQQSDTVSRKITYYQNQFGCGVIDISPDHIVRHPNIISMNGASPAVMLKLVRNALFVLTNSFHGTALSVVYRRPFAVLQRETTFSRMTNLLTQLSLTSRVVPNSPDCLLPESSIDWTTTESNLSGLQKASRLFLTSSLHI